MKILILSVGEHYILVLDRPKERVYNVFMVGRKQETQELNNIFNSGKAELVAIYGRRRVGKTYLVDETFKNRITFRHAGLSPVEEGSPEGNTLKKQLEHFYFSLQLHGLSKSHRPQTWLEAFFMLEKLLQSKDNGERQVVFLDELTDNDYAQQKDVGFKNVIFSLFYSSKILYNRKIKSKRNKKWINLGYC
jgi:AAA+ ATPase superfamily predicted ATPase